MNTASPPAAPPTSGALGGIPADIRLPNRRSARDSSPQFRSELSNIRKELSTIQDELAKEAAADSTAKPGLEDEVNTLYHELQRAAGKLEQEKALRKRVESELESLRSHRLRETADVVQELEKKRTELNTLREERALMKEWLDRGVSECKRVADEVTRLKGELDTSEKNCSALAKDKQRLATTIQQLSDDLAAVQLSLDKVHHEKSLLELRAEESSTMLARAEEQRKVSMAECDRLSSEVVRLAQRVKGLEDAEISMQSMCACIEQLSEEISHLDHNITTGDLEQTVPRTSIAEASTRVTEQKNLSVMVIDAKRLLQHLQDTVGRLRATVKRFVVDKQRTFSEMSRQQQAQLNAMQQDKEVMLRQYKDEKDALQRRVEALEREIVNVADGVQRDMQHEANERLAALDRLTNANKELVEANERLHLENEKLRVKAKKMKIDWSKVDESRRRYQQLQLEVAMMKEYNEKLTTENRNLKLMTEVGAATNVMSQLPGGSSRLDAVGTMGLKPAGSLSHVQHQAFQEWREQTLKRTEGGA